MVRGDVFPFKLDFCACPSLMLKMGFFLHALACSQLGNSHHILAKQSHVLSSSDKGPWFSLCLRFVKYLWYLVHVRGKNACLTLVR